MENFFYEYTFYSDLDSFIDAISEEEDLSDLEDTDTWECNESDLEPLLVLTKDWLYDRIPEERFDLDESESVSSKLNKALDLIDYKAVTDAMPKLYYESRRKFTITKQDLVEYIK